MATHAEILHTVGSVLYNLTPANLNVMAERIAALNVKYEWLLDKVTRMIHNCALNYPRYTELYAQLCARVIRNRKSKPLINSKKTFLTLLVPKCRRLLYSYKTPTCGINYVYRYRIHMVANCKFIGELYNQGILLDKTIRSIIEELINDNGYIQRRCLRIILKSVGPKLTKIDDMTEIYEFMDGDRFCGKSKNTLTNNVKVLRSADRSTRKDADELIVETTGALTNGVHFKNKIFNYCWNEKLLFSLLLLVLFMFSFFLYLF